MKGLRYFLALLIALSSGACALGHNPDLPFTGGDSESDGEFTSGSTGSGDGDGDGVGDTTGIGVDEGSECPADGMGGLGGAGGAESEPTCER
jgi:hypothetical protein